MKQNRDKEEEEMKIAIGCDPNAQEAKEEIIKYIEAKGYGEVTDFGSDDPSTPMLPSKSARLWLPRSTTEDPDLRYRYRGVYRGQQVKEPTQPLCQTYIPLRGQDSATMPISPAWARSRQETRCESLWWTPSLETSSFQAALLSQKWTLL